MKADYKVVIKYEHENEQIAEPSLSEANKLKSLKGYFYGLVYTILECISYLLIKMSPSYNGFNHGLIRYVLQLIFMGFLASYNGHNLLGKKEFSKTLIIRGLTGTVCIICSYLSLHFIDVSDTQTIINSSMLITAVLGRVFLNEKFTICHVLSILLNISGLIFILRPSFLFGSENELEKEFDLNITAHNLNVSSSFKYDIPESYSKVLGVGLSLGNALSLSLLQVITRSLVISKIHFSVISLYPAYVGIPVCLIFSSIMFWFKIQSFDQFTGRDTFFSISGSVIGIFALIFLNKALEHEQASKVALLRISGIFFSMIFQYFILDIEIDFLGLIGAGLIIISIIMIVTIKLFMEEIHSQKCLRFLAIEI